MAPPTRSARAKATVAIGLMGTSGIVLAYLTSVVSPAWANRYFAAFVGPILLLGAADAIDGAFPVLATQVGGAKQKVEAPVKGEPAKADAAEAEGEAEAHPS